MFKSTLRTARARALVLVVAAAGTGGIVAAVSAAGAHAKPTRAADAAPMAAATTATPIKHLVVIFQENVSFDHYFGTYPNATNPSGEPSFKPAPGTPTVNGLTGALRTDNPNLGNPQRWDRSQAVTCDQDHDYTAEQSADDHGLMDRFVQDTGSGLTVQQCLGSKTPTPGNYAVMDYYDGNTVTAMWNYAQHFALNDNFYGTTFGPSTPGAINVTGGNTYGTICGPSSAVYSPPASCTSTPGSVAGTPGSQPAAGTGTTYSDADPNYDVCSVINDGDKAGDTIQMGGNNIGDLLDKASGVTWGWFQGGFASPGYVSGKPSTDDLSTVCTGASKNIAGAKVTDYSPHHEPFEYYRSTANAKHLPPTSIAMIGKQDQANHQYDLRDFFAAAAAGDLPEVSYLKAPKFGDGHAGYSDPLDEQSWLVHTINKLESLPTWSSTAVVITYDDSDGWYDHVMGPVTTQSQTALDTLTGTSQCGASAAHVPQPGGKLQEARCGVGPRLPALVISPYARQNFVDNTFTDQSSIIRFIEDNWLGGQRIGNGDADATAGSLGNMLDYSQNPAPPLFLDPSTGEPK